MKASDLYNPMMKWLLRSPLHFFVSKGILLITFTGRKSGKVYTTPVEYAHDGADIIFFSLAERTWWKNLRGGAPVTVRVRGKDLQGTATAITGDLAVFEAAFNAYLRKYPGRARFFDVRSEADGTLNAGDIAAAANRQAVVRVVVA